MLIGHLPRQVRGRAAVGARNRNSPGTATWDTVAPMVEGTSVPDVLRKARETLSAAQLGLSDLVGSVPDRRGMGLWNVAVFGRSVTLVLQNLRTVDRVRFDAWYAPYKKEMGADPLMQYFTKLRNEILKEGPPRLSGSVYINRLDPAIMRQLERSRPPGATGFFVGDEWGGVGWTVAQPDGRILKYYVDAPPEMGMIATRHFQNPPTLHLGKQLPNTTVEALCTTYVAYLTRLVEAAETHFGS